jgi:GGDEF domain-containing protein
MNPLAGEDALARWVRLLRSAARASDVLGRLGPSDFAVLAPATGAEGARGLARRLTAAARDLSPPDEVPLHIRIGYDAVENMAYAPINPIELLGHANVAERHAAAGTAASIVAYRELDQAS